MKNLSKIAVWAIGIVLLLWGLIDFLGISGSKNDSQEEIQKRWDRLPWLFMGGVAVLLFGNIALGSFKKQ